MKDNESKYDYSVKRVTDRAVYSITRDGELVDSHEIDCLDVGFCRHMSTMFMTREAEVRQQMKVAHKLGSLAVKTMQELEKK